MANVAVIGAQWGDEGKGKIVDWLSERAEVVVRFQGGHNAGHTLVIGNQTYRLALLPSGVVRKGKLSIIGNGVVVDPWHFLEEVKRVTAQGLSVTPDNLKIANHAVLILPLHRDLDGWREDAPGVIKIGTTRRGIGPAYADKASRIGIRVQDVLDPKILRQKIEVALAEKNLWLERIYEVDGFELEEVWGRYAGYAERLAPFVGDVSLLVDEALRDGKRVLFEGAQATMLDLDHGTYPFVTSSNPVASGAATGTGIGPTRIDRVIGVSKAYVTRVGEGPFPSEIEGPDEARLRELGGEFGTVTGRERRCGWLDLVALRYAVRVNGITSLALTKLDVLSAFAELPVCVRYRLRDGSETPHFPAHQSDFHHARPVWDVLPGWQAPLDNVVQLEELPPAARSYVEFVSRELAVPIELIGVGAERERVLV